MFWFVALQSKVGQEICNYIGVDPNKMDSIILYEPGAYYKSEAALKIGSQLGFLFLVRVFKIIPVRVRNHFTIILPKQVPLVWKKGPMHDSN
jgi:predicted DCC family thiol-disulfide oxidoreductase YuxK